MGLAVGDGNVIAVVVAAQDGETTQSYSVTVTRAGSGDAGLSALSLSGVTLSPTFTSGTTAYAASVGYAVTETTVTATAVAGAAYVVKLNGVVDQDGIVPLAVGDGNVIAVVVTAQDGESSQSYTVTVTRAGSADASLSGLSFSGDVGEVVALSPAFASGTADYTAAVAHNVSAVTVTVSVASAGSAYEVRLNGVVDQDGVVPLAVGAGNVITVIVTAQDGGTTQTYTVTVTRAGSSGASLSALSLSGVTLTPVFASETTAYFASVANSVTETTVTATLADEGAAYDGEAQRRGGPGRHCAVGGWGRECHCGRSGGAGRGGDDNIHGDCHESGLGGRGSEWAIAERGDAVAGALRRGRRRTRRRWGMRWRRRR